MDPKKLRQQYIQLVPRLNRALKHVQSQLEDLPPSDFSLESNLKPYASVKRKVEADRVKNPVELSDLARGRLFFSDQFDADDLIDILHKLFGQCIFNIDDKRHRSEEHGLEYHGITHVDMDMDGVNFELQLVPIEYEPHKEFLHQIYEKFRNPKTLEKMTDRQKDFLRKVHNKAYAKLALLAKHNRSPDSSD
jgi:hypothetical protein